ncbi:MAG TPA: hypothetical protein VNA88_15130 [Candidatus Kapabacteria bacterium]|jgi:hypothetical protein|nr:hypothetical protein [Candidatus Kapabacteria bacterium]
MKTRVHLPIAAFLLLGVMTAAAQLPRTISFQGALTGADGKPLTGPHTLAISLYDTETLGAPLFTESHGVELTNGIFNLLIGSHDPLPGDIVFDKAYWLGVMVDGQPELAPRMPLTAVPYAINAAHADRAEGAVWSTLSDTASNLRGGAVNSINGRKGAVTIVGAGSARVTAANGTITISGTGGSVGELQNTDTALVIADAQGPTVTLNIRDGGIRRDHLRDLSVNVMKVSTGTPPAERGKALMSTGIEIPIWGYPTAADLILPFYRSMTMNDIPFALQNMGAGTTALFSSHDATTTNPALDVFTWGRGSAARFLARNTNGASSAITAHNASLSSSAFGVVASSAGGTAVVAASPYVAVRGISSSGIGLIGNVGGGESFGVVGYRASDERYEFGALGTPYAAVYGESAPGSEEQKASLAGLFIGDVVVEGNLRINGTISTPGSIVRIDHPLDPSNRYLDHALVESSEMLNVYSGTVVLDASGQAVVRLPEWFETATTDHRYQLTCVGGFAPVYVGREVRANEFTIAGGSPGLRVSWQITGVRNDRQSREQRFEIVVDKAAVAGARPSERSTDQRRWAAPEIRNADDTK